MYSGFVYHKAICLDIKFLCVYVHSASVHAKSHVIDTNSASVHAKSHVIDTNIVNHMCTSCYSVCKCMCQLTREAIQRSCCT